MNKGQGEERAGKTRSERAGTGRNDETNTRLPLENVLTAQLEVRKAESGGRMCRSRLRELHGLEIDEQH